MDNAITEKLPNKCHTLRQRSIRKRIETERNKDLPKQRKPRERPAPLSKYRRKTANARERQRMHEVNLAFDRLKLSIPHHKLKQIDEKKDTKITTLRCAITYINSLSELLTDLNTGKSVSPEYYFTDAQLGIEPEAPASGGGARKKGSKQRGSGRRKGKKKGAGKKGGVAKRKATPAAKLNSASIARMLTTTHAVQPLSTSSSSSGSLKTMVSSTSSKSGSVKLVQPKISLKTSSSAGATITTSSSPSTVMTHSSLLSQQQQSNINNNNNNCTIISKSNLSPPPQVLGLLQPCSNNSQNNTVNTINSSCSSSNSSLVIATSLNNVTQIQLPQIPAFTYLPAPSSSSSSSSQGKVVHSLSLDSLSAASSSSVASGSPSPASSITSSSSMLFPHDSVVSSEVIVATVWKDPVEEISELMTPLVGVDCFVGQQQQSLNNSSSSSSSSSVASSLNNAEFFSSSAIQEILGAIDSLADFNTASSNNGSSPSPSSMSSASSSSSSGTEHLLQPIVFPLSSSPVSSSNTLYSASVPMHQHQQQQQLQLALTPASINAQLSALTPVAPQK